MPNITRFHLNNVLQKAAIILFSCLSFLLSGCVFGDYPKTDSQTDSKTVKWMVISDIHYFDPSLFSLPPNNSLQDILNSDRRMILESSAILKNVLATVLAEKPDFLLVTGDLTKDGEKVSHLAVAKLFKTLTDNGIKVLVIPGNHDINNPNSYSYQGNTHEAISTISASEFASIYADCGYGNAIECDPNSLSYVSEPVKGIWVLGVDACHYTPINEIAGSISTSTLPWVKSMVAKAKQSGKTLITMMHHGLSEHFYGQSLSFPNYLISDWNNLSQTLADQGMKVVFTGHFHAQDIVKRTGLSGFVFDIETGSTVTSPCPYRIVTLNTQSNHLRIESKTIDGVFCSTIPAGISFQQYARDYSNKTLKPFLYEKLGAAPFYLTASYISSMGLDQKMSNAVQSHFAGDEVPSTSDLNDIQTVMQSKQTVGIALQSIWTDPYPADNQITINLSTGAVTTE